MERNLSMENRLSFNRPIAESTFRASISNSPTFQWGGRRNLNNSMMNKSITKSPVRERTGLSKIDARIYADVQSRGLSSRIVKYHDSLSSRLNRSSSMNNLSSESRKFPATRITKPELPYKTGSKQNVSMTHIAPPSKSAFYGNTLSGLLRSNSVIALQHNDDDISSENRPIIHPPVTEKELQPTRSVLEVLKEISRKRINNEDGDEADTSKKYCNRVDSDLNGSIQSDYRNVLIQTPQTYKRQRESTAEYSYNSSRIDQNAYLSKLPQNRQEASSPEQHAKRRQCNYNNDITSSLSSSKKSNNKRKLFEYEGDIQQEKHLRYQSEIRLPELSTALSYVDKTPITPIPNTPQSSQGISPNEIPPLLVPVQKSISVPAESAARQQIAKTLPEKPKLTLFNKNYKPHSEEPIEDRSFDVDDNAYTGIQFVKPKKAASTIGGSASHLLMERTQKSKLALMLSGLRGELYLGDEEREDKPAVTQQKKSEENQLTNSTVEPSKTNAIDNNKINTTSVPITTTISSNVSTTTAFVQPTLTSNPTNTNATSNTSVVDGSTATSNAFSILSTPKPTTTTATVPTKIISPLTGIKLTPQTTATATTTSPTVAPIASVAPTFSFGIGTAIPPTSTTNSTVSKTSTMPLPDGQQAPKINNTIPFTIGTSPQIASTASTTNQPSLPIFGLSTGQEKTPGFTMKPATAVSTATSNAATFSFGTNPTSTAVSSTTPITTVQSTLTPVAATLPLFAFGSSGSQSTGNAKTAVATTSSENSKTTTAAVAPFSFGGNKTSGGFSFGATTSTTNAPPATEAPKMFSFTSPKTTTASGGFSFGGATTTENKSTASTANIFGNTTTPINFGASSTTERQQQQPNAPTAQPTQPATNSSFVFGSKPAGSTSQEQSAIAAMSSNTFGSLIANNQSKPFSFGTSSATTAEPSKATANIFSMPNNSTNKPFSFGGSSVNTTTPTTTATTTNTFSLAANNNQSNLFNFGGSNTNTNTLTEAPKPNNSFGFGNNTQSKHFSFGTGNAEAPKSTFSFGSAANNTVATTEAPKANSNFSFATNNTFNFGGAVNKPNTTEPPKMASITATSNNAPTNAFSFGTAKSPLAQNNTFGAAPSSGGQSNVFNFSGSNTNGATNTVAAKQPNPTFNTFSGSTQGNTFTFGNSNNTATPATPISKPTTFGTVSSNTANQSNTFMFGGATNNNPAPAASSGGNLFAMPNNNNNNPPPPFGGTANTTGTSTNVNLFAASPQSSSSDRPIRRATRRLTKS